MPQLQRQKTTLKYSRRKEGVEIDGAPADVKRLALPDLLFTRLWPMVLTVVLLILLPKAGLFPWCGNT